VRCPGGGGGGAIIATAIAIAIAIVAAVHLSRGSSSTRPANAHLPIVQSIHSAVWVMVWGLCTVAMYGEW
jgi:hypothetical protein